MKTPNPQSSGPSALPVEKEKTSENTEGDPPGPKPADEGDIQMEYCSGYLYSQRIQTVIDNYL
jgi:hypothetical protein